MGVGGRGGQKSEMGRGRGVEGREGAREERRDRGEGGKGGRAMGEKGCVPVWSPWLCECVFIYNSCQCIISS